MGHIFRREFYRCTLLVSVVSEAVSQYIEDGHARPIDEDNKADNIRYLPHHGVFREDRATTKCRVVYDSTAKMYYGHSLNSCLLKSPKLQPDLGSV